MRWWRRFGRGARRKRRERQPDYHIIARLEVELGFEEPKVPEVPEWIVRDWDRVARSADCSTTTASTGREKSRGGT
jgi:hypothetical protein